MNNYIEMKLKKNGVKVRVYNISISAEGKGSYATVWSESERNWQTMKINQLIPVDEYIPIDNDINEAICNE